MRTLAVCFVLVMFAGACGGETENTQDMGVDTTRDQTQDVAEDLKNEDAGGDADQGPSYLYPASPPSTVELGERRGYKVARSIIHAHSINSHDACDGDPRLEDGSVNEPCNQDFRDGVCGSKQDIVFLTDHEELAAFTDYNDLLLLREGDETVMEDGEATANRMGCENGHRPLILPGGEYGFMTVGLKRHAAGTPVERDFLYNQTTPETADALRALGGVVLQAHTEARTVEELRTQKLDGLEIYSLHTNLGPDIRKDYLGLEPAGWIDDIIPFFRGNAPGELAFLSFFIEIPQMTETYDTLLAEGQNLTAVAGTDCHQNVNFKLADGIRVDAYIRVMRWFSNNLLVTDRTPQAARDAVAAGRLYIAYEALGTPVGFEFRGESGTSIVEMGEEVPVGSTLIVEAPTLFDYDGPLELKTEIYKAEPGGAVLVASDTGRLEFVTEEAGAYRSVVRVTPRYLAESLKDGAYLAEREFVWIYSNPIYVAP